jgi:hypothetical protein
MKVVSRRTYSLDRKHRVDWCKHVRFARMMATCVATSRLARERRSLTEIQGSMSIALEEL